MTMTDNDEVRIAEKAHELWEAEGRRTGAIGSIGIRPRRSSR